MPKKKKYDQQNYRKNSIDKAKDVNSKTETTEAETKVETTKTSKATKGKVAPQASKVTKGKAAPQASKATKGKAAPQASKAPKGKAAPEASKATKGKAAPEASKAPKGKAAPQASKATKGKAAPQASKATKGKAAPQASKVTKGKGAPEASKAPLDHSKSIIDAPSGMFSDEINKPFEHEMILSTGGAKTTQEERQNKWSKMANYFRANSLWMLMYCTGCCAIELPQAMTSRYDMERLGMGPMATPRQADILLITGYLSLKTLRRLIYTYEQMSEPKYVVGFGPCTLNGGIYHDSHAVINQLDQYVPIDLYIAGCMPKPEAVMNGFQDLITLIESGKATGWKDYHARYEWYKQNQKEALGEVMVHDEFHE